MKNNNWRYLFYALGAIALTLGTLWYQHLTGPTYEKDVAINIGGTEYEFELTRSHDISKPCLIKLAIPDKSVSGEISYRRFPTNEDFKTSSLERLGDTLSARLPLQPMAGKLQYLITLKKDNQSVALNNGQHIVVRFKGHVPLWVLRIHIFLMFASYLVAGFAGLLALFDDVQYRRYTWLIVFVLGLGGLVLGPIVQKYAFDVWWSGIPFGWDLTDNKLLIAFFGWFIAALVNIKKKRRWWVVAAFILHIITYSIPHSAMGSELDYNTGKVGTSERFKDQ